MQRHVRWMISGMALVSLLVSASCGTESVAPDVSEEPRPINCPEVAYVGDGAEPEGFDAAGEDYLLGIDVIYPEYEKGARFILLDARPPADFVMHTIVGAISVPYYDVPACAEYLPKDTWIVTFCACPHDESVAAAEYLKAAGFTKVVVMDEGYIEWRMERSYPTTDNPGTAATEDNSADETADTNDATDDASDDTSGSADAG